MPLTLQTVIDLARLDLNDSDPDDSKRRWPDATLLKHTNFALLALLNRAPHLWTGNFGNLPNGELPANSPWPVSEQYVKVCADVVCALAHSVDDEEVLMRKAASFLERAMGMTVA